MDRGWLRYKQVVDLKGIHIITDTNNETVFIVIMKDEQVYTLEQYDNGLYFFDTSYFNDSNTSNTTVDD